VDDDKSVIEAKCLSGIGEKTKREWVGSQRFLLEKIGGLPKTDDGRNEE